MAPNSNDKTENTSDEAENNEHNSKMHVENGNRVDWAKYSSKKNYFDKVLGSTLPNGTELNQRDLIQGKKSWKNTWSYCRDKLKAGGMWELSP